MVRVKGYFGPGKTPLNPCMSGWSGYARVEEKNKGVVPFLGPTPPWLEQKKERTQFFPGKFFVTRSTRTFRTINGLAGDPPGPRNGVVRVTTRTSLPSGTGDRPLGVDPFQKPGARLIEIADTEPARVVLSCDRLRGQPVNAVDLIDRMLTLWSAGFIDFGEEGTELLAPPTVERPVLFDPLE